MRIAASFGFGLILLVGWSVAASAAPSNPTPSVAGLDSALVAVETVALVPTAAPAPIHQPQFTTPVVVVQQLATPVTAAIKPVVQPDLVPAIGPALQPILEPVAVPPVKPLAAPARPLHTRVAITTVPVITAVDIGDQPASRPSVATQRAPASAPAPTGTANLSARGTAPPPAPASAPAPCGSHPTSTTGTALQAVGDEPHALSSSQSETTCSTWPPQAESTVASGPDATPD